jgi:hypothetical protein
MNGAESRRVRPSVAGGASYLERMRRASGVEPFALAAAVGFRASRGNSKP